MLWIARPAAAGWLLLTMMVSFADISTAQNVKDPATAEEFFQRGKKRLEREDFAPAIADLGKAIALDPKHVDAYVQRSMARRERLSDMLWAKVKDQEIKSYEDAALADCNQAIALAADHAEAYVERGRLFSRKNETDKALADFNKAIELNPTCIKAYWLRGDSKHATDAKGGRADWIKASQLPAVDADSYNVRGLTWEDLGDLAKAVADFSEGLKRTPHSVKLLRNRGSVYLKQNLLEEALADFDRALEIKATAWAFERRGRIHREMREPAKAMSDLNKAIELNPHHSRFFNVRAILRQEQKEFHGAFEDVNRAILLDPKDFLPYYNRGNFHVEEGKLALGLADYTKAIELNPRYAQSYVQRGIVFLRQSQPADAEKDFAKAFELEPSRKAEFEKRIKEAKGAAK